MTDKTNKIDHQFKQSASGKPYIDDNGVWISIHPEAIKKSSQLRPALFLDRDGVINIDVNYLSKVEDVRLHDGASTMIAKANALSIPVIVITNQSGVGRGYFDWNTLGDVQNEINRQLNQEGAHWDGVFACPFHMDGLPPYNHDNHPYRKPNPGMLELAADLFSIDLSRSWVIGDKADDLKSGINAGLCGGIHVNTRFREAEKERQEADNLKSSYFKVMTLTTVLEASHALPLLTQEI